MHSVSVRNEPAAASRARSLVRLSFHIKCPIIDKDLLGSNAGVSRSVAVVIGYLMHAEVCFSVFFFVHFPICTLAQGSFLRGSLHTCSHCAALCAAKHWLRGPAQEAEDLTKFGLLLLLRGLGFGRKNTRTRTTQPWFGMAYVAALTAGGGVPLFMRASQGLPPVPALSHLCLA